MSVKRETVAERKAMPLARGVLDYFPDALLVVAEVSRVGNEQHHPGEPMHWDKSKSSDEADALMRHLLDRGKLDTDGLRHSAKVAWRALALLQRELDAEDEAIAIAPEPFDILPEQFKPDPELRTRFMCGHSFGEEPITDPKDGPLCGTAIHWSRVNGIELVPSFEMRQVGDEPASVERQACEDSGNHSEGRHLLTCPDFA